MVAAVDADPAHRQRALRAVVTLPRDGLRLALGARPLGVHPRGALRVEGGKVRHGAAVRDVENQMLATLAGVELIRAVATCLAYV